MNWKRMWAMFMARNMEFFRDRAAFGWNFLFPFFIIVGFGIIFSGRNSAEFKVGVFPVVGESVSFENSSLPKDFIENKLVNFVGFETREEALGKLRLHKIDFLTPLHSLENQYWINESSPKGYIVERMFKAGFLDKEIGKKMAVNGEEIRYLDWLFPGILAMNMMFSSLWGVGYVVVRYRKNGALKRLKATPLTALEFLTAQMLSRIFLLMFTIIIVWIGSDMIFSFRVLGSYADIFIVFFLGSLSLTSMGLLLAARGISEEFTTGILNFISWPMMFLSEVWFSIEGAPGWVKTLSQAFPLTHLIRGIRKIMNDGAGLADVGLECGVMVGATVLFLALGAILFSWND